MLLQRLNVFNIFLILIYFFYRKKTSSTTNGLFASRTKEDVTNLRGALSNIKKLNMTADEYVARGATASSEKYDRWLELSRRSGRREGLGALSPARGRR
jgi:hypothetical protein